jgi:5'-phosphate synthase pdxT subunit
VFIRAPVIVAAGKGVDVLARYGDSIVACRQGNRLASTFHPELTADPRFHGYFMRMVAGYAATLQAQ